MAKACEALEKMGKTGPGDAEPCLAKWGLSCKKSPRCLSSKRRRLAKMG
ncbi:MAG: hypothetical protein CM1200mP29_14300 [Verrucomicrobiota bacterium]|nr:MAG: hypothetical protein CM1200mP29_14300 [Verrucomicrobiota bacterium]